MTEDNQQKTPKDLMLEQMKKRRKKCNGRCDEIDNAKNFSKYTSKETQKVQVINPYKTPDANEDFVKPYNLGVHNVKQNTRGVYTKEDIEKANGPKITSIYSNNFYDSEKNGGDVLDKVKTSDIMNDDNDDKIKNMKVENGILPRDIPHDGTNHEKKNEVVEKNQEGHDDIDILADEELVDSFEREKNKKADNEVDEIDSLGDEELADRFEREKNNSNEDEKNKDSNLRQENIKQLQSALDDVRDALVTKKRRTEKSFDKIRSLLGRVKVDNVNEEVKQVQDEYNRMLTQLREVMLEERDDENISEERKREINAEIKFMAINEGIKLNDAESKARLETKWGTVGDKIQKMGLWYKNLPKKVKYAMAGALFAGGVALTASGGGIVAGGALTFGKGVKRLFGATAVGVGVGAGLETKVKAKREAKMQEEMKKFTDLSIEEQNELIGKLDSFDSDTQKEYEKIKTARRRIKFAAIGSAAALLVGGKVVSHMFAGNVDMPNSEHISDSVADQVAEHAGYGKDIFESATDNFTEAMKETRAYEHFKIKYGEEAYIKFLEKGGNDELWTKHVERARYMYENLARTDAKLNLAHNLARQMGIDNPNSINVTTEGGVPTEINGQSVPENLLTPDQKKAIAFARKIKETMSGDNTGLAPKIHHATGGVNEGVGTDWLGHEDDLREGDSYIGDELKADDEYWDNVSKNDTTAHEIAKKMGIDNSDKIEYNSDFSEINGHKVPQELLTQQQKDLINTNKAFDKGYAELQHSDGVDGDADIATGNKLMSEYIQRAKDLPLTDRDKMEEYLIKLNKESVASNGVVNEEILRKQVEDAFTQYKLTGEIPTMPEMSDSVDVVDMHAAMDQMTHSAEVDNPLSQGFNHIEVGADSIGTLIVDKGNSIEGALIKFLRDNSDKLTEGGMGWNSDDPRWGGDVSKWAGARAHGLAEEFAKTHQGIDLDMVQPGIELKLDLSNPADIKLNVDFEGGPRIVPETGKVDILDGGDDMDAKMLADNEVNNEIESMETNADVVEHSSEAIENKFSNMSEIDVVKELMNNVEFKSVVAGQMQEMLDGGTLADTLRNIAPINISALLTENNVSSQAEALRGLQSRAVEVLGKSAKARPGVTVGNYFTRIFAKAVKEGKVEDIFPSAKLPK